MKIADVCKLNVAEPDIRKDTHTHTHKLTEKERERERGSLRRKKAPMMKDKYKKYSDKRTRRNSTKTRFCFKSNPIEEQGSKL